MSYVSSIGSLLSAPIFLAILAGCLAPVAEPLNLEVSHRAAFRQQSKYAETEIADTLSECRRALESVPAEPVQGIEAGMIQLANWNIRKGTMAQWEADYEEIASASDLLLIQEARVDMNPTELFDAEGYWSFAPGFRARTQLTGVATFSRARPTARCHLTAIEPWFRTPKATNITRYALQGSGQSLLVVNVHMINFALGMQDFRQQVAVIFELLAAHDGPVIVSGDFNTWRTSREQELITTLEPLGVEQLKFDQDSRLRIFGKPVDHIFIGGLRPDRSRVHEVTSSDHNPLVVTLSLKAPPDGP